MLLNLVHGYTKSERSYDLWKTPALFIIHEIFTIKFFLPEAISIILSFDVGIGKSDALPLSCLIKALYCIVVLLFVLVW